MGKGIDKFLNILSLSSTDDDDDYGIDDDLFDNEVDLVQEPPRRQKKEKPAPVSQTAATVSSGSGKSGIFSSYKMMMMNMTRFHIQKSQRLSDSQRPVQALVVK